MEIDFDHVGNGKHVLRIDVERTDYELYKFNKQGNDGYVPYWRVGDTTREMTPDDFTEFAESCRSSSNPIGYAQTETIECLPGYNSPTTDVPSPDNRVIAVSDKRVQPVFGAPLLSHNKPLAFELDTQLRIETVEEVEALLDRAIEYLSVNPNSVVYSIHQSTRAWCGRGVDRLKADSKQIDSVVEQMLGGHPRNVNDEITHLDEIRATVSIVADCYLGLFHAEIYWKHGRVSKARFGVRLEDIPFDDEFLHEFFSKYRSSPTVYDQQRNAGNHFVLLGDLELQNCAPVDFQQESPFTSYVVADNPFYEQRSEVQRQAEDPLPKPALEKFCSHERILFHISDGTIKPEQKEFQMKSITIWPTNYLFSPFYIEAECSRYVE